MTRACHIQFQINGQRSLPVGRVEIEGSDAVCAVCLSVCLPPICLQAAPAPALPTSCSPERRLPNSAEFTQTHFNTPPPARQRASERASKCLVISINKKLEDGIRKNKNQSACFSLGKQSDCTKSDAGDCICGFSGSRGALIQLKEGAKSCFLVTRCSFS